MEITRIADRTPKRGPADRFTGEVDIVEIAPPDALLVTFGPRARTAWHTYPHGQTLHILSGTARVGNSNGTEELHPGDSVAVAASERHWHGAGTDGPMAHLAVAGPDDAGQTAHWHAHVTDAEYGA